MTRMLYEWITPTRMIASVTLLAGVLLAGLLLRRRRRFPLTGKVVLVTGASSGIGEALSHELSRRGCRVILAARRVDELKRVAADIDRGRDASTTKICRLDVGDLERIDAKADELWSLYDDGIDVVIHNAGVTHRGLALETKMSVYEQIMRVNYFGPIALNRVLLPRMLECGKEKPQVLVVSSISGKLATPCNGAYAASKHAIQAYSDSLRAEHADRMHVCVVSPGFVATNVTKHALLGDGSELGTNEQATNEGFKPSYLASVCCDALERGDDEVFAVQPLLHVAHWTRFMTPGLFFRAMASRARRIIPMYTLVNKSS